MLSINFSCNSLKNVQRDGVLIADVWERLRILFEAPSYWRKFGVTTGVLYANNGEDDFGIDWAALQIPLEHATVEARGQG